MMRRLGLLGLLFVLVCGATVYAQESEQEVTDDDVNRVARELYCPICENTPLDVCETQACEDWRQLIREKLAAGQGDQEIIEYFAEIYGDRARATPSTKGFSRWIWIAPLVGAVVGAAYFVRLLRRWLSRGAATAGPAEPAPTVPLGDVRETDMELDDYVTRLEQEIRESS
jgi:cytochrome c-type biogenesis protein CcmH